ncbi:MAG: DUF4169 family protein [Rhizomicrobium sp.]|jgi:hypothetical protein
MSEVVNLRRARKAKARAEAATQADANRTKHGVPKRERDAVKARDEKQKHVTEAHRLEDPDA